MSGLAPRPRSLPIAPTAAPARRGLPLAPDVRAHDQTWRPGYAVWELTLRCDLACRHCGSRAGRARPDELSTDEALDLVRQMHELGVREITIIGGEAYLHDGWFAIARAIRDAGMTLSMTTGGRGMTSERAREARDAGIQSVSVSVDALEPMHDALRGVAGSYASAMDALRNLRAVGIPVSANTQITHGALREIEPLTEILADQGIHSWQVSMTVPMGRAADEPDLLLQPWQVLEVMPMLARIHPRLAARKIRLWPGNDIGYFGPYERILRGGMPRGHMNSCGAGRTGLGIEANGAIKGCPSLPTKDYVGGTVREHSLKDIWERSPALRFTRDRTVNDLWGHCRTCYYAEECRGGCSWTAHVLFGKIGNNPYCHHRALELLRVGRRERIELRQAAPGEPFDHAIFELIEEDWPAELLEQAKSVAASGEAWVGEGKSTVES